MVESAYPMPDKLADFKAALQQFIDKNQLVTDPLLRLAYGTDASFYRLVPQLVVKIRNESQLVSLLCLATKHRTPVTFRAAGTSLSGQAVTDSVLVVMDGWTDHEVLDGGQKIRLQPGVIGARANHHLVPYQRKIGPDPASINAAKIGGIAANNASGMCCGTRHNSYHTLTALRVVLADGAVLDSGDRDSRRLFKQSHKHLLSGLSDLRQMLLDNPPLSDKIRHKYRLKNTNGYGLNALLDFADPIDILTHLLIGSEGTLGFISEITYRTVEDHPHKATALVFFENIQQTCNAVSVLQSVAVNAVELIDRKGLESVQEQPGIPARIKMLPGEAAALLIETRASDPASLRAQIIAIEERLKQFQLLGDLHFSTDADQCARLWHVRKGLFPALGAMRPAGSTVVIEDIAFPVEHLAEGVLKLQNLFQKFKYTDALIFGHALAGNLHFMFSQKFDSKEEIERYRLLMEAVAELVAGEYGGSLKAEHGTGRNMAPFVEMEWGPDAYRLMQKIKQLFDPGNILNPGVILNEDPDVHLKNLKPLPTVDPLVDKCIECGFCEPVCPSRQLTLTPRQRIAGSREIARLDASRENPELLAQLQQSYRYAGDATCAACGLCATSCPVGINTGDLTRAHRRQNNASHLNKAVWAANNFDKITKSTGLLLNAADKAHGALGSKALIATSSGLHKLSAGKVPIWHPYLPTKAQPATPTMPPGSIENSLLSTKKVVYLGSCAARTMGPARGDNETGSLAAVNVRLLEKAGFQVLFPEQQAKQCCGMPFHSKGFPDQALHMASQLATSLMDASEQGRYPIFCDTSPCTARLHEALSGNPAFQELQIFDSLSFIHDQVLPFLNIVPEPGPVALHVTCSAQKMGLAQKLIGIAKACSDSLFIPEDITCCGFAGDRGFSHPELNASALQTLKFQVRKAGCKEGFSNSRTCEIGLSQHSDMHYRSISYLVDRVSKPLPVIESDNTGTTAETAADRNSKPLKDSRYAHSD